MGGAALRAPRARPQGVGDEVDARASSRSRNAADGPAPPQPQLRINQGEPGSWFTAWGDRGAANSAPRERADGRCGRIPRCSSGSMAPHRSPPRASSSPRKPRPRDPSAYSDRLLERSRHLRGCPEGAARPDAHGYRSLIPSIAKDERSGPVSGTRIPAPGGAGLEGLLAALGTETLRRLTPGA